MTDKPKSGSPEAVEAGCSCPIMDNSHGKGRGGDGDSFGWWISGGCPMHGTDAPEER